MIKVYADRVAWVGLHINSVNELKFRTYVIYKHELDWQCPKCKTETIHWWYTLGHVYCSECKVAYDINLYEYDIRQ